MAKKNKNNYKWFYKLFQKSVSVYLVLIIFLIITLIVSMLYVKNKQYNELVQNDKEYYAETNNTDYGKKGCVQAVWNKAKIVSGKDPRIWREDCTGKLIRRSDYGLKIKSPYCWQIDHIKPKSKNGSNKLYNLQALNCKDNRLFSNTRQKCTNHLNCCIGW